METTKSEIEKVLLAIPLETYGVKALGLFGSYARAQNTRNSDIDILVDFNKETFDNYSALSAYLKKKLKKKIDLVCFDAIKQNRKKYIMQDVQWVRK
jgi:uncharacterized protein